MTAALTIAEVSARSPDMDPASFAELVESIRANGQMVPIVLSGGDIIDGRKRYTACVQLGIEPKCIDLDPSQDAEQVAVALNLLRTHYSPSQRAMFAAGRATATRAQAVMFRYNAKQSDIEMPPTAQEAGLALGVAASTVQAAKRITRTAAREVVEAVRAGHLTLHAAKEIAATVPLAEQPNAVEKVIHASRGKARHTPTAVALGRDTRPMRLRKMAPATEVISNLLDRFELSMDLFEQQLDRAATNDRVAEFVARLRKHRSRISAAITTLETVS